MPRELPSYRDYLERLDLFFPACEVLSISEAEQFTGRDRRTLTKILTFNSSYISKVNLARGLARLGSESC